MKIIDILRQKGFTETEIKWFCIRSKEIKPSREMRENRKRRIGIYTDCEIIEMVEKEIQEDVEKGQQLLRKIKQKRATTSDKPSSSEGAKKGGEEE